MSHQDKLINVAVRRILTSQWVDITLVSVRTTGGVVYLRGRLQRMTASHPELTNAVLRNIDQRIRRLPSVHDVRYELTNWERKLTAAWVPK